MIGRVLLAAAAVVVALAALVAVLSFREPADADPALTAAIATTVPADPIARGEYLTRAGNCMGCHTARGGAPYAGGRGIETPFGTVYASNLTPDRATGLGDWSADDFWRALHHGRSRDGRLLYPAFPYPNYTRVVRADADAIHAYLRSLAPVEQTNRPHALRFPFNLQASLAVWRALYFEPGEYVNDAQRPGPWNRGAYLVEGFGHCNACHSARNFLGASAGSLDLAGGLIPVQNWYAPSLTAREEASVAHWEPAQVVALLKTGVADHGVVTGPMSEVVRNSTQYLSDADLAAMAAFLQALPVSPPASPGTREKAASPESLARGAKLYEQHCAACHGEQGAGVRGAYPALADNRAVTMASIANLVHIVLEGGYAPSTAGNPRPFGMPPFATVLDNAELADLLSYVRQSWGHRASAVSALEVGRFRDHGSTR